MALTLSRQGGFLKYDNNSPALIKYYNLNTIAIFINGDAVGFPDGIEIDYNDVFNHSKHNTKLIYLSSPNLFSGQSMNKKNFDTFIKFFVAFRKFDTFPEFFVDFRFFIDFRNFRQLSKFLSF